MATANPSGAIAVPLRQHDAQPRPWDQQLPLLPERDYPGCRHGVLLNLERVVQAASGIEAIADVLFRHSLESDGEDGPDARPLRLSTAEGLIRALGCLAGITRDAAHECAKMSSGAVYTTQPTNTKGENDARA